MVTRIARTALAPKREEAAQTTAPLSTRQTVGNLFHRPWRRLIAAELDAHTCRDGVNGALKVTTCAEMSNASPPPAQRYFARGTRSLDA